MTEKRSKAPVLGLVTKTEARSDAIADLIDEWAVLNGEKKLTGAALVGVDAAGNVYTGYNPGENVATLIGAIERVKFRICQHQQDRMAEDD